MGRARTRWPEGIRWPIRSAMTSGGGSGMPGPRAGVRATAIVVRDPLSEHAPQVAFVQRDQKIQALPADRAHQPLAKRIGLRGAHGRFQHAQIHRCQRSVDIRRVNRVSIVNHELVQAITSDERPELLNGPLGRGMLRHVPVRDPACPDFQDDEHVENPERGHHRDKEVAREHGARVIADKRVPLLRRGSGARRVSMGR